MRFPSSYENLSKFLPNPFPNPFQHDMQSNMTKISHDLPIGLALNPTILETQPTLTLQNSQIRFAIELTLSRHRLRMRRNISFTLFCLFLTQATHYLEFVLTSASQKKTDIGFALFLTLASHELETVLK